MDEATELLDSGDLRSLKQVRVIELLLEHEEASCIEIRQAADVSQGVLNTLAKNGVIEFLQRTVSRKLPEELEESNPPTLSRRRKRKEKPSRRLMTPRTPPRPGNSMSFCFMA